MVKAYQLRQDLLDSRSAYFVSCLMNIEGKVLKRKISVKDLLKPLRKEEEQSEYKNQKEYFYKNFPQLHNERR